MKTSFVFSNVISDGLLTFFPLHIKLPTQKIRTTNFVLGYAHLCVDFRSLNSFTKCGLLFRTINTGYLFFNIVQGEISSVPSRLITPFNASSVTLGESPIYPVHHRSLSSSLFRVMISSDILDSLLFLCLSKIYYCYI